MQLHYGKDEVEYLNNHSEYVKKYNENFIYVQKNFISENVTDSLLSKLKKHEANLEKGTGVAYTVEQSIKSNYRNSSVGWISKDDFHGELGEENQVILEKFNTVNADMFNLDIDSLMKLQYTTYGEGEYFNWHPDGPFAIQSMTGEKIPENLKHRKLSMSICLSRKEEYEGGEFCIILPNRSIDNIGEMFKMDYGDAIIFPAFCAHKVNTVTRGMRRSLVYWFCGPRWR